MKQTVPSKTNLGGGFKYFLFSPLFGEDEPILTNIFQKGWNHQPVTYPPENRASVTEMIVFQTSIFRG